jgi:hypothetical protein
MIRPNTMLWAVSQIITPLIIFLLSALVVALLARSQMLRKIII